MTVPPCDLHVLPEGGRLFIGPLAPAARQGLLISVPGRETHLTVRGTGIGGEIPDRVEVRAEVAAETGDGDPVKSVAFLPVRTGFWLRLVLAEAGQARPLRLTLSRAEGLRFVLVRAGVPGLPAPFRFGSPPRRLPPVAPRPEPRPEPPDAAAIAEGLAAAMRAGRAEAAENALIRLPDATRRAVAGRLLAALADDPGAAPFARLPFLMFLAED